MRRNNRNKKIKINNNRLKNRRMKINRIKKIFIMVNGAKVRETALANSFMVMEIIMKDIGKMINFQLKAD